MAAMEPKQHLEKVVLHITNGGAECEIYLVAGDMKHRGSTGPLAPLLDQLDSVREQYSISASQIVLEPRGMSPERGTQGPSGWKGGILKRTKSGKKRGRKGKKGGFRQEDVPAWFTRATAEKAFHLLHSLELLELPTRLARDLAQVHEKAKTAESYERASLETSQVTFEREFAKAMLVANCAGYRPEELTPVKSFAEEFKGKRLWGACHAFETECATALSRLPPKAAKQAEAPPASFPADQLPVLEDEFFDDPDRSGAMEDDAYSKHNESTGPSQSSEIKAPATTSQQSLEDRREEGTDADVPISSTAEGKQQLAQSAASVVAGASAYRAEKEDPNGAHNKQESQFEGRALANSGGIETGGTVPRALAEPEARKELPLDSGDSEADRAEKADEQEQPTQPGSGVPSPLGNKTPDRARQDETAKAEEVSARVPSNTGSASTAHETVRSAPASVAKIKTKAPEGSGKPSVSDVDTGSQGSQDDLFDIEPGVGSSSPVLPSSPARGARPLSWSDEEGELKLARHSYEGMSAIGAAVAALNSGDHSKAVVPALEPANAGQETGGSLSVAKTEGKHAEQVVSVGEAGLDGEASGREQSPGVESASPGSMGLMSGADLARGLKNPTVNSSDRSADRTGSPVAAPELSASSDIDRLWLATKHRLFNLPDRETGRSVADSLPQEEQDRDVASDVSEAGSSSQSGKSRPDVALESSQVPDVDGAKARGDADRLGQEGGAREGAIHERADQADGVHETVADGFKRGSSPVFEVSGDEPSSGSRKAGAVAAGVAVAAVGSVAAAAVLAAPRAPRGSPSVPTDADPAAMIPFSEGHSSEVKDTAATKTSEPQMTAEKKASEPPPHSDPTQAQPKSRSYDKPWLAHAALPTANGALPGDARKAESGTKDNDRRVSEGRARRESMNSYKERRQAKMKEQEERSRGEHEAKLKALADALEKRKAEMAERSRRSVLLAAAAANRRAAQDGSQTRGAPMGTPEEDKAQARERLRKYRSDKGLSSAEPSPPAGSRVNQLLAKLGNMVGTTPTGQEETRAAGSAPKGSSPGTKRLNGVSTTMSSLSRSQEDLTPSASKSVAGQSPRGLPPGAKGAGASPRSQSTPRSRSGGVSKAIGNKIALPVGEQDFARSVSPGRGSIVRTPEALQRGPSPSRPSLSALGPGQASPGRASLATTPRSAASPFPSPRGPLTGRSSGGWNKPETTPPAKASWAEGQSRGRDSPQNVKRPSSVVRSGGANSLPKGTSQGRTFGRSPRQSPSVTPGTTCRSPSMGTFGGAARSSSPGTFGRAARADSFGGHNKTGQAASKFVRPTSASTVHRRVEVLSDGDKAGKKPGNSRGVFQPGGLPIGHKPADASKPAWSSGVRVTVTDSASKPRDRFGNRTALPPTPQTPRPWRTASAAETPRRPSVSGTPRSMSTSVATPAPPQNARRAFGPGGSNPLPAKAPSETRPRRARHSIANIPQSPGPASTPRRSSGGWGAATSTRDTVKVPAKAGESPAAPRTSSYLLSPKDRVLSQTKASQAKQAERALPGAAEPGPRRRERRSISGPVQGANTPGARPRRRASTASLPSREAGAVSSTDAEVGSTATNVRPSLSGNAPAVGAGFQDSPGNDFAGIQRRVKPRLNGTGTETAAGEAGENLRRLKGGFVEEWVRGTSMKEPREGVPEWESSAVPLERGPSQEQVKQGAKVGAVQPNSDSVERLFGEEIEGGYEQRTAANARQQKLPTLLQARPNGSRPDVPAESNGDDLTSPVGKTNEQVGGGENGSVTKVDVDVLSTPKMRKRWEGPVEPLVIQKSPGEGGGALGKLGKLFSRKAINGVRAEGEASPAK